MNAISRPSLSGLLDPPSGATTLTEGVAHLKYRPDIDGLRAIAVLSVVGFHAFPVTVRGGFTGVDIFFVISGYLISTIILGNVTKDRFSFVEFYSRRVRRIFPALGVVLLATFGFGGMVLLASEYAELGKHVAAGAGFVSNFVLWAESGYFDTSAESKPLLHLWSLAIEEQFYILWPIVLCVGWKRRWNLLWITVTIVAISFAFNIYVVGHDEIEDFYSPLTRSWELLVGGTSAYLMLFKSNASASSTGLRAQSLSLAGMGAICAGLTLTTSSSPFPGWWALLPVIGTALVIAAGPAAAINRWVLGSRPLVWFGLISFPLYLWHWPILSFLRVIGNEYPTRTERLIAIVAAIVCAWLTYRLIERPLRFGKRAAPAVTMLLVFVASMGVLGFVGFRTGGFEFRPAAHPRVVNDGDLGSDDFHEYIATKFKPCMPLEVRDEEGARCAQSKDGAVNMAIVGDSHAENIFIGFAEALPNVNVAFYMHDSIPVLANRKFAKTYDSVISDPSIHTVLITSWWFKRLNELSASVRVDRLQQTIDALTKVGKRVYLVDDTPNFSFTPRFCKYESGFLRTNRCVESARGNETERASYQSVFTELLSANPELGLLRTYGYFCDAGLCSMGRDGTLYFRDSNHLTISGSRFLAGHVVQANPDLVSPR